MSGAVEEIEVAKGVARVVSLLAVLSCLGPGLEGCLTMDCVKAFAAVLKPVVTAARRRQTSVLSSVLSAPLGGAGRGGVAVRGTHP